MKAWQVWALVGLVAGITGVLALSWVTRQLFEATNQMDGILPEDRARVKWASRAGWALIGVGFVAQAVSVLLAGSV